WRGVRHPALDALIHVVLGALQRVPNEHEFAGPVEVPDREDALEDALQADFRPLVWRNVRLEELFVRPLLNIDEVRDINDLRDLPEAVADAEVGLNHRRHCRGAPCRPEFTAPVIAGGGHPTP